MLQLRRSLTLSHAIALVAGAMILAACGPVSLDLRGLGDHGGVASTTTYVVKAGDTLSGIAAAYGARVEDLIALNAETYPRLAESQSRVIVPGWRLKVPAAASGPNLEPATSRAIIATAPPVVSTPKIETNGGYFDYEAALEIVRLTNDERGRNGLPALSIDEGLMSVARERASALEADFSHAGFYANGCAGCSENIAGWYFGQTAQGFVQQWIKSAEHRENMLQGAYGSLGVGVYRLERSDLAFAVQIMR